MHETLVAQQCLAMALDRMRQEGAERVTGLRVRMGALEGIGEDAMQAALDLYAAGTPAEGARVRLDVVPPRLACRACGRAPEGEVHGHEGVPHASCPCGGTYRVLDGAGWSLESVRVVV